MIRFIGICDRPNEEAPWLYISLVHFILWFSEMLYQDIMFSLMRFSRTWKD